jgi:beta-glucosidase-like glycosyl hydrolase
MQVAALGRATLDGLRRAGVVGVVKHIPGHGRAGADSHVELPVVDADAEALEIDIEPFRTLAGAPMAMTAHVVYRAWDAERCASLSPTIIADVIRGRIGFDGLLMSDDLGMHALQGDFGERAAGVIAAGCDVALHCSGDMAEMRACAAAVGEISPAAADRLARAMASISTEASARRSRTWSLPATPCSRSPDRAHGSVLKQKVECEPRTSRRGHIKETSDGPFAPAYPDLRRRGRAPARWRAFLQPDGRRRQGREEL